MFKNTIRTLLIFLFAGLSFSVSAQSSEEVEASVKEDIMERYPGLGEFTLQNQLVRVVAEFELNDTSYTSVYSSKGKWQHTIYGIDPADLPAEVTDGFEKSKYAVDWEITAAEVYDTPSKGVQYRITVEKNQFQKKYLYFNEKGRLIRDALTL
ncbi:putative PepSY-like beta-lactamase-inhibitor [Anseongella ginsenosidimutans]|uniref:Putative PepSY-like beta-lactamase-inhibitor n=1 Tax=Anseongella ginsenosidimutans TaxID=496056 RepID=A0A4R3KUJ1_9SPHI|nr:PepSY-like domain-containing protein [Anseongella ginsenosidimutans]QEC51623.1 hypothetical protein FRZ59_04170 [Anseongella ginsenosidimutans]TCS88955.1 putative PepSY-like beta-lactamase-inhibitor [Anseongella ginsenosidimutans]